MAGFSDLVGAAKVSTEDGTARMSFIAADEHLNPAGTVHGGLLATLVDTAMGYAAHDAEKGGALLATSQLTVTYLNPGQRGEMLVTARVRKRGRHLLVCEADVEQDETALVHAVATFAATQS